MLTYSEQSTKLALDSSIAVLALSNPDCTEIELLPLKPGQMSETDRAKLAARWPGRGLCSIGVIGLLDGRVHMALKEPLDHIKLATLALAFTQHCGEAAIGSLEQQQSAVDVAWLEALHSLEDNRPEA